MKIFRKLLIILLLTLTIPTATLFADFRTVEYTITFTDNHGYDLETGLYKETLNYQVSNRIEIKFDDITLDALDNFHHLLFFDKNNKLIGYYNTIATTLETSLYLGNVSSFTPTIPAGAKYFAFQSFYPYYNNTPIPEIGDTLANVFDGSSNIQAYYDLILNTTLGLDAPIAELNNHTLREVFDGGQLLTNSNIDNNTNWANYAGSTVTFSSGKAIIYRDSNNGGLQYVQNISVSNGDKLYLVSNERKTVNHNTTAQTQIGLLLYNVSNTILSFQSSNISVDNTFKNYTTLLTLNNINVDSVRPLIYQMSSSGITELEVDSVKLYNLNTLGISALTVSQMDYWFNVYQAIQSGDPKNITTAIEYLYINGDYKYYIYNGFYVSSMYSASDMADYWSPLYETTFSALNNTQLLAQYNWYVNNYQSFIDFDTLDWYPTDTELDAYYLQYYYNLIADSYYPDTITFTELQTVTASYTYEYTVDTRDPITKLNDFLDDINLGSTVFKFSISIIITILSMVLLYVFFKPSALVLIIDGILFTILFVFIGWIPNYIIILLGAILFYLLVKNGGSNNEE